MRRAALALAGFALVGCSHATDGRAHPAVSAVKMLPTEGEMSDAVGNGLSTFDFQPFVGGLEIMPDGFRDDAEATPIRCIGVTETMLRLTYENADVVEAARQSYFTLNADAKVSGADAAVVRFVSRGSAEQRYRVFVEAWQGCDGQSVVKHLRGTSGADVEATVTDVAVDGQMLTASVSTRQGASAPESHYRRAVAVRDSTIVEVSLAVANGGAASGPDGPAARAARIMSDKSTGES